jgi:hypothetical protein
MDNPLVEAKTVEEMGFEDGHVVMLELIGGDNEWPRDKYARSVPLMLGLLDISAYS